MHTVRPAERAASWVLRAVGSRWFLWLVVGLFASASAWIALTGAQDFLYDESYHFGIVQVYTHQWTPFIHQGTSYAQFGDITRFGSYLYHYLVSFPVRAVGGLGGGLRAQLVMARLCSVAFMSGSLPLYWLLVRELGASRAVAGVSVALFTSVPIVPALAATVNYDNLVMLLTPAFLLVAVRLYRASTIRLSQVWALLALGAFASLTKYTFLPIFVGAVVVLVGGFVVRRRRGAVTVDWRTRGTRFWIWGVLALTGIALFVERYVVNVVLYHSLQPDCSAVHPTSMCMEYPLWARNYTLAQSAPHIQFGVGSLASYFFLQWIPTNFWSLQFVGTSARATMGSPMTAMVLKGGTVLAVAFIVLCIGWIAKRPGIAVVAGAAALYVASLLVVNIRDYYATGQPVGVQGRYLLPFAPIVIALAGMSLARIVDRLYEHSVVPKALIVVFLFLCTTQGGGAFTFFAFSGDDWWALTRWPLRLNHAVRLLAKKLLIG